MYKRPVILSSVEHSGMKISPVSLYGFAKHLNSCVLLGQEFPEAAKQYPVLFSRNGEGELISVVMLGIKDNLFVAGDGSWGKGCYLPAFIRRFPYLLAEGIAGDGSLTVCIDADYPGFSATEGEPLFGAEAAPTSSLTGAIDFLKLYHAQAGVTKGFLARLTELNLLKSVDANITLAGGDTVTIRELLTVDEEALLNLSDTDLLALARCGYLSWIYAQLSSLTNFSTIVDRAGYVVSQKEL
jgi:hypothetical protein